MSPARPVGPATFIVGHPRSGTSLLRSLLDGHPELTVLPFETHLMDWATAADPTAALLERTRLWSTLHDHMPDIPRERVEAELRDAFSGAGSPEERLTALVRGWAGLTGGDPRRRWVEKTPRHLYELNTFFRWFGPEARAVILVRDPRDVMASQLKQDPSRSVLAMSLTCRVAHEAVRDWVSSERVRVVAYEDVAADASAVMGPLCDFLGLARDPAASVPTVMGDPYGGNSRFQDALKGVSTRPVGRFREVLSAAQQRQAEILLKEQLVTGGYPTDDTLRGGARLQRMALEAVARSGVWRSRRLRRALRGG